MLQRRAIAVLWPVCLLLSSVCVDYAQGIYTRSEPGESPPSYCTVFLHMVKCAGSTVKHALRRSSYLDGVSKPVSCRHDMGGAPECIEGLKSATVISTSGPGSYGQLVRDSLHDSGRSCEYFTMMREPVDRLISAFFYCPADHKMPQVRPPELCGQHPSEIPAKERLLKFAQTIWKNKAFMQLSIGIDCPPHAVCNESSIGDYISLDSAERREAMDNVQGLLSTYRAVGIMEYFDLSMELFHARVKSPVRNWRKLTIHNQGQSWKTREEVLQWARQSPEIHRAIEADLLLYGYAVDLFKNQTYEALGTLWEE